MIKSRLQAITLILLIFLSPFYFSDFVPNVNANPDWLTGWQYRKSHVINPASGAGTNYQIRIKVYYGSGTDSGENVYLNGKCRSDFGDIRFTDNDGITLLDYWMESKVDSNYAIFWVKVADDLSIYRATIYIYYGNSDAITTSNGENTFLFFDDFLGSSYDPDKWVVVGSPTINVSNGELTLRRDSYSGSWSVHGLRSKTFQMDEKRVLVRMKVNTFISVCAARCDSDYYSKGYTNKILMYYYTGPSAIAISCDKRDIGGGGPSSRALVTNISPDTYYVIYTTRWASSYFKGWVNGEYKNQVTSYVCDGSTYIGLFLEEWGTHETVIGTYDWIAVAKYVDPEPSHGSWGSEETSIIERFAYQTLNIQTSPFRQSSYSRTAFQAIQILTHASRCQGLSRFASQLVNFVADATRQLSYERTSATQLLILTQTLRQTSYSRTANQLLNIIIASSRQTSHNRLINIPLNIIAEATRHQASVRSVDQQIIILVSISRNVTLNRFASQKLTFLTELWLTKALRRFASQVLTILTEATRHQAFHRLVNQPLEILLSASRKAFYHRTAEVLLKIHTATSIKFILYIEVPIPTPTPTPAPALPSIQLDAIIQTAHIARLWWKPTSTIEVLVINKGIVATDVTFEYVMLDINNQTVARGQQTVFISGLDKKTITINILTPPDGTYTVHFQTTAPVKVEAKTVTLTVETPFYGKLSFTILLIMLAVLIIYLASRRKRR